MVFLGIIFPLRFHSQLIMELRLVPEYGGDGTSHGITALNDTGSNILTVFDIDFLYLGAYQFYSGWYSLTEVLNE
jgi:hypothetical protein